MQLLTQYTPSTPKHDGLPSWLLEWESKTLSLWQGCTELHQMDQHGCHHTVPLSRPYKRMAWDPQGQQFYAVTSLRSDIVYRLTPDFAEIERLPLRLPSPCSEWKCIWMNPEDQLLYLVNDAHILRCNRNGDSLGIWMSSRRDTRYTALSTYQDYRFAASLRAGSAYLTSYTREGVWLEELSLGSELVILSLQPVCREDQLVLLAFGVGQGRYPTLLEIELDRRESPSCLALPNLMVECVSQETGLQSTCFVQPQEPDHPSHPI